MRFASLVVAAAVAVASSVCATPAAHAQIEVVDTPVEAPKVEVPKSAPPAVIIGDAVYVLVDGTYRKVDSELPVNPNVPDRGLPYPDPNGKVEEKEPAKPKEDGNKPKPAVVEWLVPLLVTGGVIAGLAALFHKLYPSGRLIMYYQPGTPITL